MLGTVKYRESGLIVDVLTESRGRMSFMSSVSHGRSHRGLGASVWQPLSMVSFCADMRNTPRLAYPHDVHVYMPYADLPFNPVKTTQALFVAEFLRYVLRDAQADALLYKYIETSLCWLDSATDGFVNFHIVFMMRMSRFVGIFPNVDHWEQGMFFDMQAAEFRHGQPPHPHFVWPDEAQFLPHLMRMNFGNMRHFRFSRQQRFRLLSLLVDFYRLHVPGYPDMKSLDVLREVFD